MALRIQLKDCGSVDSIKTCYTRGGVGGVSKLGPIGIKCKDIGKLFEELEELALIYHSSFESAIINE